MVNEFEAKALAGAAEAARVKTIILGQQVEQYKSQYDVALDKYEAAVTEYEALKKYLPKEEEVHGG